MPGFFAHKKTLAASALVLSLIGFGVLDVQSILIPLAMLIALGAMVAVELPEQIFQRR